MHKGVILLVKADDRDDAISQANDFLEPYGDGDVWDWFVIGGRWSGNLNTLSKTFYEKAKVLFEQAYPNEDSPFLSTKMVEEQEQNLHEIWNSIGGKGQNPYSRSSYVSDGFEDDCIPLTDCVPVIQDWKKDMVAEAETTWNKMIAAKSDSADKYDMSAYYAGVYRDLKYDSFSFESNVYDVVNRTNNPSTALENPEQWWAVQIDMHN